MARLKVFAFDYAMAGGPMVRIVPRALSRQGAMLFHALLADLGALPDVELQTLPGSRASTFGQPAYGQPAYGQQAYGQQAYEQPASGLPSDGAPAHQQQPDGRPAYQQLEDGQPPYGCLAPGAAASSGAAQAPDGSFDERLAACVQAADAVWPLASESDGLLERLSRDIVRGQRILLGSAPGAVQVAASKLAMARVLADGGVPVVPTYSPHGPLPDGPDAWVVKPDDGAGCLDTRLFSDRAAALAWLRTHAFQHYVLQPFIAGEPGSLSLLCCDGKAWVLACNRERVAVRDNRFHFLGSTVNGLMDADGGFARLAGQVAAALPTLWGYVGVNFIRSAEGVLVLDVNPRLTAAYAGLHASIGCNPAGLVLALLQGKAPAPGARRRPVSVDLASIGQPWTAA